MFYHALTGNGGESSKQYTELEVITVAPNYAPSGNLDINCNIDDLVLLYLEPRSPGDITYNISINGAELLKEINTDVNSGANIYHRKTYLYKATAKNVQGTISSTPIDAIMTAFKIS